MITLFVATNRPNSNSRKIANYYDKRLGELNIPHQFFTLENIQHDMFQPDMYFKYSHPQLASIQDNILAPTEKYIFIIPEYNGSFPGVFKTFIDATDVKKCFHNKKACMVGVADGRAGNLRGMEHLTNIFNHIKMNVLHLKVPISMVSTHFNGEELANEEIKKMIDTQIELFKTF